MLPLRTKKKPIKILFSFPVLLILIVLTVTTMRGVYKSFNMHNDQKIKAASAMEDLSALKKREKDLSAENDWLKTSRGQEELFREQYMVAKEGENVMVITSNDDTVKDNTVTTETKDTSLLTRTKNAISGY